MRPDENIRLEMLQVRCSQTRQGTQRIDMLQVLVYAYMPALHLLIV